MNGSTADFDPARWPGPPADSRILKGLLFAAGASLVLAFAPFEQPWLAPLILALLL